MHVLSTVFARSLSILGNPLLVMPATVAVLVVHGRPTFAATIVAAVCGIGGAVLAFSLWQVRRGHWRHVDASDRTERRSLNLFLAVVLFAGAALAYARVPEPGLALGLLLSGLLIMAAMATAPWLKLSLHTAFAVYAVALLWPLGPAWIALASAAAAGIGWSRVRLARHTIAEAWGGGLVGGLCGLGFWLVLRLHG